MSDLEKYWHNEAVQLPHLIRIAILALRTEVERAVLIVGKRTPNAHATLNLLYRKPVITVADIEEGIAVTIHPDRRADAILRDLAKLDIIKEITGQSRWRTCYLRLFLS